MQDFHDREMVDWRCDMLGEAEQFCASNILQIAPRKFRPKVWMITLLFFLVLTLSLSLLLYASAPWLSNMFGNISAGLIASVLVLFFTIEKDKNISYYESLLPYLKNTLQSVNKACNALYNQRHGLSLDSRITSVKYEHYYTFIMKAFLLHKVLIDLYRLLLVSDRTNYQGFSHSKQSLYDHECDVDKFLLDTAKVCSNRIEEDVRALDKRYSKLWEQEMTMMRDFNRYANFLETQVYSIKYGHQRVKPKWFHDAHCILQQLVKTKGHQ